MGRIADIALWISRRLRLAVMALIAVAALKTGASALDRPDPSSQAGAPITHSQQAVSP
mgnify:CR=1 FL=1